MRTCAGSTAASIHRPIVKAFPSPRKIVRQLNIGNIDRGLRILVGLVLVVLAGFGLIGIRGYIGVVQIATG